MDVALAPGSWLREARRNAGWLIALGVLGVIVGMLAIGSPLVAGVSVSIVVGTMLVITGLVHLAGAFKAGSFGSGAFGLISGLLTVVCGLLLFFRPVFGLTALTLLLAVYFFVEGAGWSSAALSGSSSVSLSTASGPFPAYGPSAPWWGSTSSSGAGRSSPSVWRPAAGFRASRRP
jgi:hypothetical protein